MPAPVALPSDIRACLFDLDGVLTRTTPLHAAAWRQTFDGFLAERASTLGEPYVSFSARDYEEHVDGRERDDGVRAFLASRGIELSEEEVARLGSRKSAAALALIRERGVEPYPGSVRFLHAVRAQGLRTAVVSASSNCAAALEAAGIADLLDARIDAVVAARNGLRGKPAPDMFLAAARALGVEPGHAAVFEDAPAGIDAGRAGGFGLVVGVARHGESDVLRAHAADVVVSDLSDVSAPASRANAEEIGRG